MLTTEVSLVESGWPRISQLSFQVPMAFDARFGGQVLVQWCFIGVSQVPLCLQQWHMIDYSTVPVCATFIIQGWDMRARCLPSWKQFVKALGPRCDGSLPLAIILKPYTIYTIILHGSYASHE